jgi:hypothetical protein
LAFLTKTKDRNLALLLGRALDAQKFFHDVNYEHRLRDSRQELYRFTEHINVRHSQLLPSPPQNDSSIAEEDDVSEFNYPTTTNDGNHPNGVFTLLLTCYSPTCSREKLCYSVFCPRRLEQVRGPIQRMPKKRLSLSNHRHLFRIASKKCQSPESNPSIQQQIITGRKGNEKGG